jgi:hypothetical protein
MKVSPPIRQRGTSLTDLVALSENDIAEVARFIATQSGRTTESVDTHLRWFLLENPARQPQDPLGFGVWTADQLVGCILCSPQAFCFNGNKIVLMGSSSFYVDESHRGHGGRVFLQYSRLGNKSPLFGTSANADAAALWKAAGANPIPYADAELFGVLHWPPVAEEFMLRRHSSRWLSRLAGSPISNLAALFRPLKINDGESNTLQPLSSAEQVNNLPIHASSLKLTALRDLPYIRWRYFSGHDATVAAFSFRSHSHNHEVLITVNQRPRGYRGQINTLNVLDVYPEVPADEWLRIIGALISRYRNIVHVIVLRCQNPERLKIFCEKGFQRRMFDAPTSWFLDKAKLLSTHDWYSVPADGDGLI